MLTWARAHGFSVGFEFASNDAVAGDMIAVSTRALEKDEIFLKLPSVLALCPRVATETFPAAEDFFDDGEEQAQDALGDPNTFSCAVS